MIFLASVFSLLAPNAPGGFGPDVPEDPLDTDHPLDARLRGIFRSDAGTQDGRPVIVSVEDLTSLIPGMAGALDRIFREALPGKDLPKHNLTAPPSENGTKIEATLFPFENSWANPKIDILLSTGTGAECRFLTLHGRYFNAGTPEAFPAFHKIYYTGAWGKDGGTFRDDCVATEEKVRIVLEAMKAMRDGPAVVQTVPQGPGCFLA